MCKCITHSCDSSIMHVHYSSRVHAILHGLRSWTLIILLPSCGRLGYVLLFLMGSIALSSTLPVSRDLFVADAISGQNEFRCSFALMKGGELWILVLHPVSSPRFMPWLSAVMPIWLSARARASWHHNGGHPGLSM